MKKSRKQFIKDGHSAACQEWKTKIEKEFPKLFKETELVVGKWYKTNEKGTLWFLNNILKDGCGEGYGLCFSEWRDNSKSICINDSRFDWEIATDKEVEAALIKEAKKRGFKEGVKYKSASEGNYTETCNSEILAAISNNQLCSGGGSVFLRGKWATIIETITKEEAEKLIGKTII